MSQRVSETVKKKGVRADCKRPLAAYTTINGGLGQGGTTWWWLCSRISTRVVQSNCRAVFLRQLSDRGRATEKVGLGPKSQNPSGVRSSGEHRVGGGNEPPDRGPPRGSVRPSREWYRAQSSLIPIFAFALGASLEYNFCEFLGLLCCLRE